MLGVNVPLNISLSSLYLCEKGIFFQCALNIKN
jgi:hypothetical protein